MADLDLATLKKRLSEETDPTLKKFFADKIAEIEGAGKTAKKAAKSAAPAADEGWLEVDASGEDFAAARSGFPVVGSWAAEFGLPYLYDTGTSICFPFHVPAPGYSAPFENDGMIWGPKSKAGAGVLKSILGGLGVAYETNPKTGLVRFKPSDVAGKIAKVEYLVDPDATYVDKDGNTKPSTIAKAKRVLPLGAEKKSLGI